MRSWLAFLILGGTLGAQDAEGPDRVILSGREEIRGTVLGYGRDGSLRVQIKSDREQLIALEEILRVQFGKEEPLQFDSKGQKLRLFHGGLLTGAIKEYKDGRFKFEGTAGSYLLRRADVKSATFGPLSGSLPEFKDEKADILVFETQKKDEKEKVVVTNTAEYGELISISDAKVKLKISKKEEGKPPVTEEKEFERAGLRQIYLNHDQAKKDLPAGWFAKLVFRNGDKLVGVLSGVDKDSVTLFSHLVGEAKILKKAIHQVSFVQYARMTVGNVLLCDQTGVREFDRSGKEIWSYNANVQYAWSAVKLDNGNVLISNTNYNQVLEVTPDKKVVWQMDNVQYPYDAQRLDNGNTLVAEYYANRVAEYDSKTKAVVWECNKAQYPISCQRLENGNTLVSSNYQVVEFDKDKREVWKANLRNFRPWRATRLDNGNTLITDYQRGQVVELDATGKNEVWRMEGLQRPVSALRLEDGNTLILEQQLNRVIEVDPSKRITEWVKNLNYPQGMSGY